MTNWYECISVTNFSTKVSTDVYQVYYYIRLRGAPFTLVDTRMLNIFIYKSTMMQYESICTLFTGGDCRFRHVLPGLADAWGRHIGFCLGIQAIFWGAATNKGRQKYSVRLITLFSNSKFQINSSGSPCIFVLSEIQPQSPLVSD